MNKSEPLIIDDFNRIRMDDRTREKLKRWIDEERIVLPTRTTMRFTGSPLEELGRVK